MNVRRARLLLHVIRLSLRAPRDRSTRWERYWAETDEVLWDAQDPAEAAHYTALLARHADPALPIVDLGCGSGLVTRALGDRVVGVDIAPAAVARAGAGDFRVGDITDPALGRALHAELGDCTVFLRGVLHILDPAARRRVAETAAALVGRRGSVLIAETDFPGPLLGYLESLGAGPHGIPRPLARALETGIPRPRPFGDAELADAFPPTRWERVVVDHSATIAAVPMRAAGVREQIPGHLAVLRPVTGAAQQTHSPTP
ncbi:class I SAM-dependent methyltransferase [Pseudonocardia oroxyli]|uniref:Methyltransferase domain-containing protein n=1 Tax=Pseudonocardia oroxyli TaxID=366584 RepID=A0A1G7Z3N5_PSEOR|nr:class I SAM-dependent methyltransferase [Pseudonocardia oroxyli]SDH03328.1 Methyltransferase domain-containing protein [Pseudonocardia oroxyli]